MGADGEVHRRRHASEAGSVLVETAALGAVVIVLIAVLVEVFFAGYTALLATHAARSGARALAVGADVTEAVENELPTGWREGLVVRRGSHWVEVEIEVPVLVPGEGSVMSITGYAAMDGAGTAGGSP